jgi:HAD superfamily 5'-nucleotidase-like hydrolase
VKPAAERGVFCNRTLNLRAIRAIGFDMDYTLIHYREEEWERRAYAHARGRLAERGWPVADLRFDPRQVTRGLAIDLELGNLVKANRFGYVQRATHGTRLLDVETLRRAYARTAVDLAEPRFVFLNTLFSLSEGTLLAQLVDRHDAGELPDVHGYAALHREVRVALDAAHMEGALKREVREAPGRFVVLDPELAQCLLDLRHAGKRLLLVTNSEWSYVRSMMSYALDAFLGAGRGWRELFDVVIVAARKPSFFGDGHPLYEVAEEGTGLLRPVTGEPSPARVLHGGSAASVERLLGLSGDQILYFGDHLFADVRFSKAVLRWRTALVLRELEDEIRVRREFSRQEARLATLMGRKQALEQESHRLQLARQRARRGHAAGRRGSGLAREGRLQKLRDRLAALDREIAPLAKAAAELGETPWGPLMRAGNDKSLFAQQVERHADFYTSRVSNLLAVTPFAYLRAPRTSLPHDLV